MYLTLSLQKAQNFFFCFFCQPFSSFSLRGFLCGLAIPRGLLLWAARRGWSARPDRDRVGPVAAGTGLPLVLRGGPLQAGGHLLGLVLDRRALVALRRLPRVGPEPPDDHHAHPLG